MYLYKESEILNELPIDEANFIRNNNININTDIVELIEQLEVLMQRAGIETESGQIIEDIIDKLTKVNIDKKYYRIIFVEDYFSNDAIYFATSSLNDFQIGDDVLLERGKQEVEGFVREVGYYIKTNLPSSLNEMYSIKEITYRREDI